MSVVLHIERLVLDGLPVSSLDSARLRAALAQELAARLADGGLAPALQGGGALPRVAAPEITVEPRARPDAIGRAIAGALHVGMREA